MGRLILITLFVVLAATAAAAADKPDPLSQARSFYNQRDFEAAVNAAERARLQTSRADSADLIAARAYLERFRVSAASDDLTSARIRLGRLDPQRLGSRERTEFIIGLGEALYFDESYGASAAVFASVVDVPDGSTGEAHEGVLDWWATALDRDARGRPDIDRRAVYDRIHTRMHEELAKRPGSGTAAYWLAAAARGTGDLQAAWDAAEAGWVRASLVADHGAALREDLDRLMQRGIIPERAKGVAQSPENLRLEWERFKERWRKN